MNQLALVVEGVSKKYQIGQRGSSGGLRQSIIHNARQLKRRIYGQQPLSSKAEANGMAADFWALKDVSFNIRHGETVGVIGRNGAGKSTLLKILSQITKPTSGSAKVYGRLGSLLEVGTGFHPELTGRENIFLNATILGLSRRQIIQKFDEIVAFAEIERFVDTPVKYYSSGMYMRLAFSVSAHLDPEILVLDEVLAVGDAAFQKKCMGKMEGVAKDGRTVLLVSHSIATIVSFCDRCLLLDKGQLIKDGDAAAVAEYYQESQNDVSDSNPKIREMMHLAEKNKTEKAVFKWVVVTPQDAYGAQQKVLRVGGDLAIQVGVEARHAIVAASVTVSVFDMEGNRIIDVGNALKDDYLSLEAGQTATLRFTLHNLLLRPGSYRLSLWLGRPPTEDIDTAMNAAGFDVEVDPRRTKYPHQYFGVYQCEFTHAISIN